MLGFARSLKIDSSIEIDKLSCPAQCGIDCVMANLLYPICFAICVAKCKKTPSSGVNNCLSSCGLTKPINVESPGVRDLAINQVNSCLQSC
ncbi:hypothetical protein Fmac_012127 [Flemingia macrophylla]|uniref:Thionin-like protein n=1 Tax=Flemingia macrophylla TaxID=520843 RepID=A0ABD1MPT3_9FABA